MSAMIPIQSNQVRGGTRISPPFLSFFPLSLCLSSAIRAQLIRGTLTRLSCTRNRALATRPPPFQPMNRPTVELETLGHAQAFHPEQLARRRRRDNQLMSLGVGIFRFTNRSCNLTGAFRPIG